MTFSVRSGWLIQARSRAASVSADRRALKAVCSRAPCPSSTVMPTLTASASTPIGGMTTKR